MRRWLETHGHFLTREEVAVVTGMSLQDVIGNRELVASPRAPGGEETYPAAQFHDGGRPTPGVGVLAAALGDDADSWDVVAFVTSPLPTLGGQTPLDWLQRGGDVAKVIRLAGH